MNAIRAIARDLVTDIRCSDRDINAGADNVLERMKYRATCRVQLSQLYRERHTVKLDRYGWPMLSMFR